jgi:formylglycine-generating enzyme required for sulfatase activity
MKLPNRFGAYDVHGNASEWCHSRYRPPADQADVVVTNLDYCVLRGGSFGIRSSNVRSAGRNVNQPGLRHYYDGFRPARTYHLSP